MISFRFFLRPAMLLFLLVVVTAAVYAPVLGHDFIVNWDDNLYIIDNPAVRGVTVDHLRAAFGSYFVGNYAPIQIVSYMLDYSLWGGTPRGFLATNVFLHLVNGLLVYRLLLRCHTDRVVATVGAAVFLFHPVQVESVAWVSQRKNLLAILFFLLAWEGYRRYRDEGKGTGTYVGALLSFSAALGAKSVAVVLPLVLVADDLLLKRERPLRPVNKIPFFVLAAAAAVLALASQMKEAGGGRTSFHGGSPLATLFTMLPVFCRYLRLLLWPAGLSAEYAPPVHVTFDVAVAGALLLLALLGLFLRRLSRVDPAIPFWGLFAVIALLPVSQIVPLVTLMNDRYLYFPMIGFAAVVGSGAAALRRRSRRPLVVDLPVVAGIAVLALLTFQRVPVWQDAVTLWTDAAAKSPGKASVWQNLGEALYRTGSLEAAVTAYEEGLARHPADPLILLNLGMLHTRFGDPDTGREMLKRLLRVDPGNGDGWTYLGTNLVERGEYAEGERMYRKALALRPDSPRVLVLLGDLAMKRGQFREGERFYAVVEARGGDDPGIAFRLARASARAGRTEEALRWVEQALRRGYADVDNLATADDLAPLRRDPRFVRLLRESGTDGGKE